MRYFSLCELGIHETDSSVRCMKHTCQNPECQKIRLELDYTDMYNYLPFSEEKEKESVSNSSSESTYIDSDFNLEEDDVVVSVRNGTKRKDICPHLVSGKKDECVRSKCTHTHSVDTWYPEMCAYGNRCNKMQTCRRVHPRDNKDTREKTLSYILKRIGVCMDMFEPEPILIIEKTNKNTRVLCANVRNKNICFDKECVKAHTIEEWNPTLCDNNECTECDDSKCEKRHNTENEDTERSSERSSEDGVELSVERSVETVEDICGRLGIKLMSSKKYYRTKHFTMLARH